ncbi:MAG: hypothetical protein GY762_15345 [Proteobacteria bacterium]|nr:hypothetical protein [Pseudomonadota bacterium]
MDWILIVTGPEREKVWNRADVGAQPCVPARDFLSWYEYWLDGGKDWYSCVGNSFESQAANRYWSRLRYLARLQHLYALLVGSVAETLARTHVAAQFNRQLDKILAFQPNLTYTKSLSDIF